MPSSEPQHTLVSSVQLYKHLQFVRKAKFLATLHGSSQLNAKPGLLSSARNTTGQWAACRTSWKKWQAEVTMNVPWTATPAMRSHLPEESTGATSTASRHDAAVPSYSSEQLATQSYRYWTHFTSEVNKKFTRDNKSLIWVSPTMFHGCFTRVSSIQHTCENSNWTRTGRFFPQTITTLASSPHLLLIIRQSFLCSAVWPRFSLHLVKFLNSEPTKIYI